MNNKQYRLGELLNPADGHSLVLDTSRGMALGPLPGLEHFEAVLRPLLPFMDGIVTGPGQARVLGARTRTGPALLIQSDWTNALRGEDFVLPPETIKVVPLLSIEDSLDLGASSLVMNFILGHEEEIEASCIQRLVNLSLQGLSLGMPLIVNVQPVGPRVVLMNKAIELGVSYSLEGGADGVVIPWPGSDSFKTIQTMCSGMPVWVKPSSMEANSPELLEAVHSGAAGVWLDEKLFALENPLARLEEFHRLVHARVEA
jgi:DhnA family fructose-bisphosphate aldolase class Ia